MEHRVGGGTEDRRPAVAKRVRERPRPPSDRAGCRRSTTPGDRQTAVDSGSALRRGRPDCPSRIDRSRCLVPAHASPVGDSPATRRWRRDRTSGTCAPMARKTGCRLRRAWPPASRSAGSGSGRCRHRRCQRRRRSWSASRTSGRESHRDVRYRPIDRPARDPALPCRWRGAPHRAASWRSRESVPRASPFSRLRRRAATGGRFRCCTPSSRSIRRPPPFRRSRGWRCGASSDRGRWPRGRPRTGD